MFDSLSIARLTGRIARFFPMLVILAMTSLAVPRAVAQSLTQRWLKTFSDPYGVIDAGSMVKIAPDGSVIVAGPSPYAENKYDIRTAKYDGSTAAILWERHSETRNGPGDVVCDIASDSAGNVIVVGLRDVDYAEQQGYYAVKYAAADGAVLWEQSFMPSSSFVAVAVTASGDVIATGTHNNSPGDYEIDTYKFDGATGGILWKNVYVAPSINGSSTNGAKALALDAGGNAYVTGYATYGEFSEAVILKIEGGGGTTQWSVQRLIPDASGSSGEDVVVDAGGDPIVAISTTQGFDGLRVIKFSSSDGAELWVNTQNGPQLDTPAALALDSKGDVAVTGFTSESLDHYDDIFTRKISGADGQTIWTQTYDGRPAGGDSGEDEGYAVSFDRFDNVVVAGSSDSASHSGPNTMIMKYAGADGAVLLQQRVVIEDGNGRPTGKHSLVVGPGYITTTGFTNTLSGGKDFLLQMSDPATATTLVEWRSAHFGTVESVGDAADLADPDHDGVTNLAEYAFHHDPLKADRGSLPVAQAQADGLTIEFTEPIDVVGVIYGASMAATPAGPWLPLGDVGVAPLHRFRLPMNQPQGFMRLEISDAP